MKFLIDLFGIELLIKKAVADEIESPFFARNVKSCLIEMLPLMKTVGDINAPNAGIVTSKLQEASKLNTFLEKMITLQVIFVPEVPKEVK